MKTIFAVPLILSFLILTTSVQSSTTEMPWNSIRNDKKFLIMLPQLARNMGADGLFNLCATDNEFISVRPVKTCKKYAVVREGKINNDQAEYSQMKCVKWKSEIVSLSRLTEKNDLIVRIPKKLQINVVYSSGPRYMHQAFRKIYTVPDCY